MQRKKPRMWSQTGLGLPLVSCVALGTIWALSEPQLANLYNGERIISESQDHYELSRR